MIKKFQYRIEYGLVLLVEGIFWVFPRALALRMGEWLGLVFSFLLTKRRRLVLDNLAHAFPDTSMKRKREIASAAWRSIGRTAVEFMRMTEIRPGNLRDFVSVENEATMENAVQDGKGVILLTAHFSNWEISAVAIQMIFGGVTAIARPVKNPLVENWVQSRRRGCGINIILHRQAVKASLQTLKAGRTIGMLVDQNLYTGGIFVDFFGRQAATTTLPALLHVRTGAPLIFVHVLREGLRFRLTFERLNLPASPSGGDPVAFITLYISRHMESLIRRHPENWFWIHNRWKRKPDPVIPPHVVQWGG